MGAQNWYTFNLVTEPSTQVADIRLALVAPAVQTVQTITNFQVQTTMQMPPSGCGASSAVNENYNINFAMQSYTSPTTFYGTNQSATQALSTSTSTFTVQATGLIRGSFYNLMAYANSVASPSDTTKQASTGIIVYMAPQIISVVINEQNQSYPIGQIVSLTSTVSDPDNMDPVVAAQTVVYAWSCNNMFTGSVC